MYHTVQGASKMIKIKYLQFVLVFPNSYKKWKLKNIVFTIV